MEKVSITVNQRDEKGKGPARRLRMKKMVPAVVYSDDVNISLTIPPASLKILHSIHFSESAIITMKIIGADGEKSFPVLIKDVQFNPLDETIAHIDFLKVSLKEKIKVPIPIILKGEAKGVKDEEGVLTQILRELEVEGLPADIPDQVTVDVTELTIGRSIHVKDIQLPANVRIVTDINETIVTVGAKEEFVEPEVAAAAAAGPQEPEVIREKKEKEPVEGEEEQAKDKEGKKEAKEPAEAKKDAKEVKKEGKK